MKNAEYYRQRKERLDEIVHDPAEVEAILYRIAEGEQLTAIARDLDVSYIMLSRFLRETDELADKLSTAEQTRDDARKSDILTVFDEISEIDLAECYDEDGNLRPIHDIPLNVRRCIASIETEELFEGQGKDREHVGTLKKIKFHSKIQANEKRGKALAMFSEKVDVQASESLVKLIRDSYNKPAEPEPEPQDDKPSDDI